MFIASNTASPMDFLASVRERVDFSKENMVVEITLALKHMHSTKAHDLGGMSPIFIQKYWYTVGNLVTRIVLRTLNSSQVLEVLNHTHLAMIPKTKQVVNVEGDFCLISLCNVVYKLVSKVFANYLKLVLPHVISPSQNAFMLGR